MEIRRKIREIAEEQDICLTDQEVEELAGSLTDLAEIETKVRAVCKRKREALLGKRIS
jgi:hypothetical protein